MASATEIAFVSARDMLNALTILPDAGAGAGKIEVRTGAAPADCETASSGTLLATLPMSDPAFPANAADQVPGARATANAITDDSSADATGTAGYFRVFDSDSVCYIQGSAGESGDTPDMTLDDKTIVAGQTVSVTSYTIDMPES